MSLPSIASPISNGALVLRYTAFLVVAVIILNVVVIALEAYFNAAPGSMGALGLILVWSAGSWAGQIWFKRCLLYTSRCV